MISVKQRERAVGERVIHWNHAEKIIVKYGNKEWFYRYWLHENIAGFSQRKHAFYPYRPGLVVFNTMGICGT